MEEQQNIEPTITDEPRTSAGEDHGDEESDDDKRPPDEDQKKQENLLKLNEYLNSLAYKAPELNEDENPRTTGLARPRSRHFVDIDNEFREVLKPKQRSQRIKRLADAEKFLTTEELDALIRNQRHHEEMKAKAKSRRCKIFLSVLNKLEQQCRESAMRDLVEKFANYLADRCVKKNLPSIMTESFQRLTRGLVCNMYMSLGIPGNNASSKADHSIYETIAFVLADLILEAHFQLQTSQNVDDVFDMPDLNFNSTYPDELSGLKKRALRATRKISRHRKMKFGSEFNRFMDFMKNT